MTAVLILLPPSEAKSAGGDGPGLGRGAVPLSLPDLAAARRTVLDAVVRLSAGDPAAAAAALHLPPATVADAVRANAAARRSPTMSALDRYTGVLYAALDVPGLSAAERAVAERSLVVFSGLFGLVRGGDAIPAYRVPAKAVVEGVGPLTPYWRSRLGATVAPLLGAQFAVDLRSTDYSALWSPTGPLRHQVLGVRVLAERRVGRKKVARTISFHSKHGKGLLTRALLAAAAAGREPASADDVAQVGAALGWRPELRTVTGGVPALDLVDPL
jgi:cytoplasmic iron level regulating protein YaaA (DUF328/UPF0246 family)